MNQHLICLAIGIISWLIGLVIKLIPNSIFNKIQLFREETDENADMD
jgi:hypothetical protein